MGVNFSEKLREPEKLVEQSKLKFKIKHFRRFTQMETVESGELEFEKVDVVWRVVIMPITVGEIPAFCRVCYHIQVNNDMIWESEMFDLEIECKSKGENFLKTGYMKIERSTILTEFRASHQQVANCISENGDLDLEFVLTLKYCGPRAEYNKYLSTGANRSSSLEKYKILYEDQEFSDFTFIVQKRVFKVPRNILANVSPYFLKLFTTDMKEARERECVMDQFDPDDFEQMLKFIFTGNLPRTYETPPVGLYTMARYFWLDSLRWILIFEIQNAITPENAFEIYKFAKFYGETAVAQDAWLAIRNNPCIAVTSLADFRENRENARNKMGRERLENPNYKLTLKTKIFGSNFHTVPCLNDNCNRENVFEATAETRRKWDQIRKDNPRIYRFGYHEFS